jgi:excisionase family DNA binding protein
MKRRTRQPADSELMTLRDAARYLSCHFVTLQRLLAKRAIRAFRFGRAWRFRRSDLDEMDQRSDRRRHVRDKAAATRT